jgi:succinate-acetate transporter protein
VGGCFVTEIGKKTSEAKLQLFGRLWLWEVGGQKFEFFVLQSYGLLWVVKDVLTLVDHCGIIIS